MRFLQQQILQQQLFLSDLKPMLAAPNFNRESLNQEQRLDALEWELSKTKLEQNLFKMQEQHLQEVNTKNASYLAEMRKITEMQKMLMDSVQKFTPAQTVNSSVANRIATVSSPPPMIIQVGGGNQDNQRIPEPSARPKAKTRRRYSDSEEEEEEPKKSKKDTKKSKSSKKKLPTEESQEDSEIEELDAPKAKQAKKKSDEPKSKKSDGEKVGKTHPKPSLKAISEIDKEEVDSQPGEAEQPAAKTVEAGKEQPKVTDTKPTPGDPTSESARPSVHTPALSKLTAAELGPSKLNPEKEDIVLQIQKGNYFPDGVNVVKIVLFLYDAAGKAFGSPEGIPILCELSGSLQQPKFNKKIKLQKPEAKSCKSLFAYLLILTVDELGYLKSGQKTLAPSLAAIAVIPISVTEKDFQPVTDDDADVVNTLT